VVHVITRLDLGGAQQNTLFCVRHHDRRRFDVGLIAGAGGLLDDEAQSIADARVHVVPFLKHAVSPWWDLRALLALRRLLRAAAPDVVHTHSSKAGILGRWAAFLAGVPVVVHTAHGWSFNRTQPPSVRRTYVALERLTAGVTSRLLVVSRAGREEGLRCGIARPSRYELLRSGIEVEATRATAIDRDEVRASLGLLPHHLLVGTLACLKPQKAPLDFVRAAAEAHARCDRLRFLIAGDGELRAEVQALIEELGLADVVRVLGWRRDVGELLQAMDVFLLTSRFEGLPRAVVQAMAAGVPVVATAVDGTPEVVHDRRTGLLVPPDSPREAAAAVLELARDEALRRSCAAAARTLVDGEFDIRLMVRRLERVYISLLEAG
jgi:glycosyltransferase involved in cell wall biosynthesis